MTSYFRLIVIHFWKILAIKNPLDLILAPSKGGMQCVRTHVTRSQLQLKQARCKISNKGYLSLNIFVILCHNTYYHGRPKSPVAIQRHQHCQNKLDKVHTVQQCSFAVKV